MQGPMPLIRESLKILTLESSVTSACSGQAEIKLNFNKQE